MKTWHHSKSARKNLDPITLRLSRNEIEWIISGLHESLRDLKNTLTPETKREMPIAYAKDAEQVPILEKMISELNQFLKRP